MSTYEVRVKVASSETIVQIQAYSSDSAKKAAEAMFGAGKVRKVTKVK